MVPAFLYTSENITTFGVCRFEEKHINMVSRLMQTTVLWGEDKKKAAPASPWVRHRPQ